MRFAMIGLGRMGANMVRRLRRADIPVAAYNRKPAVTRALAMETGLVAADSMEDLIELLESPRAIWLMLPEGKVTQAHIDRLASLLDAGDLVIDGGNSFYKDSIARARALAKKGILFVDAGVSGGIWGLEKGYALMVGGQAVAVENIAPVLRALAPGPEQGWLHCGPPGSGHFVKMVHNGMEYGMMQTYAEGFALLKGRKDFDLDLAAIAAMWRHGSVARSWPTDLTARILKDDQALDDIEAFLIMNETQPCQGRNAAGK
jgi:6-phosphogluconate dehydrogenase